MNKNSKRKLFLKVLEANTLSITSITNIIKTSLGPNSKSKLILTSKEE